MPVILPVYCDEGYQLNADEDGCEPICAVDERLNVVRNTCELICGNSQLVIFNVTTGDCDLVCGVNETLTFQTDPYRGACEPICGVGY